MAKQTEATLLLKIKTLGQEALSSTGDMLAKLGKIAVAAYAAIVGGVTAAIAAYREQEEAVNKLNQALVNNGIYSTELSKTYQKMASELQKVSAFGDEQIISAQAQMQAYLGQTEITKELMQATLDLAAAKKMDLATAADLVGKSIGGETNALARHGVEVDVTASKTERMAQVLDGINEKWKGQAEAQISGLGALTRMKNALSDFLEGVGQRFAPVIVMWANAISNFADEITANEGVLDGLATLFGVIAKAALIAKDTIVGVAEVIGQQLGNTVGAVAQAMEGKFAMAWETIKQGGTDSANLVKARYEKLGQDMAAIDEALLSQKQASLEAEELLIQESADRKLEIERNRLALQAADFDMAKNEELIKQTEHEMLKSDVILQAELMRINAELLNEEDRLTRLGLLHQKETALREAKNRAHIAGIRQVNAIEALLMDERTKKFETGLNAMAQMQHSKSKELAAIGKAAAIAQIAFDTARGAMAAYNAMLFVPIVGPGLGIAAAAAVIAYGAERSASIAGIGLAEGGIVKATAGGVPAIIGEGGRDEAVIPLEDGAPAMGSTYNITIQGWVGGTETEARTFAIRVDHELHKLRQNGESMAFDEPVI